MKDISSFAQLFRDEFGKPIQLTPGQKEIFETIIRKSARRVIIMAATQYGKSLTVSLAVILRAVVFGERWAIVAPTEKKARIIMNYVISHLFDQELFYSQLAIGEPLERLKRERSKNRLTFRRGGEIFILSADSRNRQRAGESLMGFGAANVILDESALIDDETYVKARRMVGGYPEESFFLEIGNPFRRNHFLRTWQSDEYDKKIKIDYLQGIREGRFSQEFIEGMKHLPFFQVLYECRFPDQSETDEAGWTALVTDEEVEAAMNRNVKMTGIKRLGVDIGRGGDYTVFVIRTDNHARVASKNRDPDLMAQVARIKHIMAAEQILAENVFVDDVGVGGGVVDRLREWFRTSFVLRKSDRDGTAHGSLSRKTSAPQAVRCTNLRGGTVGIKRPRPGARVT